METRTEGKSFHKLLKMFLFPWKKFSDRVWASLLSTVPYLLGKSVSPCLLAWICALIYYFLFLQQQKFKIRKMKPAKTKL